MKMLIPPDWDGQSFCRYAVCWPDSPLWKIILRGLVSEPARGFFWDERTGTVTAVLADFRQTLDENLHLPEVIMACGDTGLQPGLEAIAQAIITASATASASANATANGCCEQTIINQNGGIAGSTTQPATGETIPIFGTQPPKSVPTGQFPEGYEDLQEYELDKCQVANLVVSGVVNSFKGLATLGGFNYGALVALILVAITGIIIFPPALIPIAAAAMGFLAVEVTVFALLAQQIEENRDYWVCLLYDSDSVETALSVIADALDAIILNLGLAGRVAWAVKTIGLLLFNGDTLNQLYTKIAHLTYPDADCSSCETCPEIALDLSARQFLASYTWEGVATYDSVGSNSSNMVGDELNLTNPTTPTSAGIYRWDVANPDNLEFSRVYIPNQAAACCNFFFFVLLEDENGDVINPFSSNGFAGQHYESAGNFDPPIVVKGVVIYVSNSISQGFDWTIEQLVLTCAV